LRRTGYHFEHRVARIINRDKARARVDKAQPSRFEIQGVEI